MFQIKIDSTEQLLDEQKLLTLWNSFTTDQKIQTIKDLKQEATDRRQLSNHLLKIAVELDNYIQELEEKLLG